MRYFCPPMDRTKRTLCSRLQIHCIERNNKARGLRAARTKRGGCARCWLAAIRGTPCVATPSEHLPRSSRARRNPHDLLRHHFDLSTTIERRGRPILLRGRSFSSYSTRVVACFSFFLFSLSVRDVFQFEFNVDPPGHHRCRQRYDISPSRSSDRQRSPSATGKCIAWIYYIWI